MPKKVKKRPMPPRSAIGVRFGAGGRIVDGKGGSGYSGRPMNPDQGQDESDASYFVAKDDKTFRKSKKKPMTTGQIYRELRGGDPSGKYK